MDSDSATPVTTVPVHITQPEDHAPPTLAEPASGPVAEMSGALQGGDKPAAETGDIIGRSSKSMIWSNADEPQVRHHLRTVNPQPRPHPSENRQSQLLSQRPSLISLPKIPR
jgi:hypothetical protein